MTTEETMLDVDFNWDEPLVTDAGTGEGKRQFAKVRMLPVPVIPFQKGASFTLPDVYDDQYNPDNQQTVRNGLKVFNGMKQGKTDKKHTIYVLVAEKADRQGNTYQRVKWFKSWAEKDRKNVWAELQFNALKGFDSANRAKFLGQGIYAGYDEVSTGEQVNIQGKDYDTKYWTNFTIFPDEAAMKKAEAEFFAQFATNGANGATPLDLTNIPAGWVKGDATKDAASVQTLYQQIKKQYDEGKAPMDIAKKLSLVSKAEGTPMPNKDGQPVNVAELFSAALDMPAAMFEAELV
jgi:hypothetical protein